MTPAPPLLPLRVPMTPRVGRSPHGLALRSEGICEVAAERHPLGARRVADDHGAAVSCELITHNRFHAGDVDGAMPRLAAGPCVTRASAILTKHRNP